MHPPRPPGTAIFRFTFSHLPKESQVRRTKIPASTVTSWKLKTFGFFDVLRVEELTDSSSQPVDEATDRHQRTLLAFGHRERVRALLNVAAARRTSGYIAIGLVKFSQDFGHGHYHEFVHELVRRRHRREIFLGCLDAADAIVLRSFGDAGDPMQDLPLQCLFRWLERLNDDRQLKGRVERLLSMVGCESLGAFTSRLARRDAKSEVKALVRITDMRAGLALPELCRRLDSRPSTRDLVKKLRPSIGYYDVQGLTTVPEAARLLHLVRRDKFVEYRALTTSTCFTCDSDYASSNPVEIKAIPDSALLAQLKELHEQLLPVLDDLNKASCLNPMVGRVATEVVNKFDRLHNTGLIPGSRLFLWTCRDAVASLHRECADHLVIRRRLELEVRRDHDRTIHLRQRHYADFFRAIDEELDRRVSLSLAAHTRFFPCSIEAPLKVVGALDMAGRLITATFRCYRCRAGTGLLQVFKAKADKPTQFFTMPPKLPPVDATRPYPTMGITSFSPRLVRHFYLALFTVFHEVAQSVMEEIISWPNFTALVFGQSYVERMAVITTLIVRPPKDPLAPELPPLVHDWSRRFLAREIAASENWRAVESQVGPEYFAAPGLDITGRWPAGQEWGRENVWESQWERWRVGLVGKRTPNPSTACHKLFRDARLCAEIESRERNENFHRIWGQELMSELETITRRDQSTANLQEVHDEYQDKLSNRLGAIAWWVEACSWNEYLELASLIPFLRLFADDRDEQVFLEVIAGLVRDYWEVWQDSESPKAAYDAARRFVVALAAVEIFRTQRDGGPSATESCHSPAAAATVMAAVRKNAAALSHETRMLTVRTRAQKTCQAVWQRLARPGVSIMPGDTHADAFADPLIAQSMVRFVVRLLHVHRIDGENVDPKQSSALEHYNRRFRNIFASRRQPTNRTLPADEITRLWALQYQLSEQNGERGYLFSLNEARAAESGSA